MKYSWALLVLCTGIASADKLPSKEVRVSTEGIVLDFLIGGESCEPIAKDFLSESFRADPSVSAFDCEGQTFVVEPGYAVRFDGERITWGGSVPTVLVPESDIGRGRFWLMVASLVWLVWLLKE